ncbi:MAG: type I polyketide synthase, partial [Cyanobacteria bacterium J06649_4]
PAAYWQLLREGRQAITDVPCDRWRAEQFYHPDHNQRGKMNSCKGGFLSDVDRFDAAFFGISAEEARHIDPQQRLFLEVAWESLEQAGIAPASLSGSATGVFTGLCTIDYHRLLYRDFDCIGPHSGTGTTMSITANRLSYLLNLRGPSMGVDAACSSSAIAVHLACQSLRVEESNLCIVGGVNLILSPDSMISSAKTGLLSPQGACRPFDVAADGYVRGEGCGVVVLKRLADAQADKDNILAIIRGSAVNQDGLSNSLSAPNGRAQQALIESALKLSGVSAQDIDYVEAHAVGTSLGDAIEFKALEKVFSEKRERPYYLGSVKSNIGHLEAASGMAALIKLILSLQNEEMPPQTNFERANTLVDIEESAFKVALKAEPWPRQQRERQASMSTFGFGGTNAHIIIEEAPPVEETTEIAADLKLETQGGEFYERSHHILVLTAKSKGALRNLASRYQRFFLDYASKEEKEIPSETYAADKRSIRLLADACFTASTGRNYFTQRLCLVSDSTYDMRRQLAQFAEGEEALLASQFTSGQVKGRKRPKVIFHVPEITLGTLQLGKTLYRTQPFFRDAFDDCAQHADIDLTSILLSESYNSDSDSAAALVGSSNKRITGFVVSYSLAKLWQHWGVLPSGLLSEGTGEYVAACIAGIVSIEEAISQLSSLSEQLLLSDDNSQKWLAQAALTGDETVIPIGANRPLGHYVAVESLERLNTGKPVAFEGEVLLSADISIWPQMLTHLGQLFVNGVAVNWKAFDEGYQRRRMSLPTYPFERARYWFTQSESSDTQDDKRLTSDNKLTSDNSKSVKSKKVVSFPEYSHPRSASAGQ